MVALNAKLAKEVFMRGPGPGLAPGGFGRCPLGFGFRLVVARGAQQREGDGINEGAKKLPNCPHFGRGNVVQEHMKFPAGCIRILHEIALFHCTSAPQEPRGAIDVILK